MFYYYRGFKLEAVRSGSWKLHLDKGELYHLGADLAEERNRAPQDPEEVRRLRSLAAAMKDDLGLDGATAPGVRELGRVEKAEPLISTDGVVRAGFDSVKKTFP